MLVAQAAGGVGAHPVAAVESRHRLDAPSPSDDVPPAVINPLQTEARRLPVKGTPIIKQAQHPKRCRGAKYATVLLLAFATI